MPNTEKEQNIYSYYFDYFYNCYWFKDGQVKKQIRKEKRNEINAIFMFNFKIYA